MDYWIRYPVRDLRGHTYYDARWMSKISFRESNSSVDREKWQIPEMDITMWLGKQHSFCVLIPVINEGKRITNLLQRMKLLQVSELADIIIIDGGSTDGSLELESLNEFNIRGLLVKKGFGKLSAQLRCGYAFALDHGYTGIVTIDGNNKDDPEAIRRFIKKLEEGFDFIQGSRFIHGGKGENTPILREFCIRFIHAPCLSFASGFKWTDSTQGFRAYSRKMLIDPKIALFRDVFVAYELLAYLSYRAPKLGYRCLELPTRRQYPVGKIPTKINGVKGMFLVLITLFRACTGKYNG